MRNNQPVTQREYAFPDQQRLISATDLKGRITYCNDIFALVSGFERGELIGAPHNLIRHPDVPSAVFEHLWNTLKSGRAWMGIVKNRRKDGDHYWVNAYVTPILDDKCQVIGYESVRTKPTREQIQRAEALYARLNSGQRGVPMLDGAVPLASHCLPFLLTGLAGFAAGASLGGVWGLVAAAGLSVPIGFAGRHWQMRGTRRLVRLAGQSFSDPMIAQMYTDSHGTEAQLEMAMISEQARLKTCLTRLLDSAVQLQEQAKRAEELANHSSEGLAQQHNEITQVATAITQMAATTQEVASNVSLAAQATEQASNLASQSRAVSAQTLQAIEVLAATVSQAGDAVSELARNSDEIGSVVDVIKGIADQTNLLALNAAIEAARAGESGRGFAVVADEVRQLAQRTTAATVEIHQLIERLQTQARRAVEATEQGQAQASSGVERVIETDKALTGIGAAVDSIIEMATHIASATEQQTAVAEEISTHVSTIASLGDRTLGDAQSTALLSEELEATARAQAALVERFNR